MSSVIGFTGLHWGHLQKERRKLVMIRLSQDAVFPLKHKSLLDLWQKLIYNWMSVFVSKKTFLFYLSFWVVKQWTTSHGRHLLSTWEIITLQSAGAIWTFSLCLFVFDTAHLCACVQTCTKQGGDLFPVPDGIYSPDACGRRLSFAEEKPQSLNGCHFDMSPSQFLEMHVNRLIGDEKIPAG